MTNVTFFFAIMPAAVTALFTALVSLMPLAASAKDPVTPSLGDAPPPNMYKTDDSGRKVCSKKNDKPSKSKQKKGIHLDMECCLDPDEIPNPHCYYPPEKYGKYLKKFTMSASVKPSPKTESTTVPTPSPEKDVSDEFESSGEFVISDENTRNAPDDSGQLACSADPFPEKGSFCPVEAGCAPLLISVSRM